MSSRPDRRVSTPFVNTVAARSGIPLGGIGAGTVEIRPDGSFADWLIFNMGALSPEQPEDEVGPGPEMGPAGLQFLLRCASPAKGVQVRRLHLREDLLDLYSASYAHPVQAIEFEGSYPCARLAYRDDSLPVKVGALAFSPVIPGDSRTSGTPGFNLVFTVRNPGPERVEVSLMGTLANPLAWGTIDRQLTNELEVDGDFRQITFRTDASGGRRSLHGTMAFSVSGGQPSHIVGAYRAYLSNGFWAASRFGSTHYSFLRGFREAGRLPDLGLGCGSEDLVGGHNDELLDEMSDALKAFAVEMLRSDPLYNEMADRLERIQPGFFNRPEGDAAFLRELRTQLPIFGDDDRKPSTWGDAALASSLVLEPGEEREVRFTVAWHFPNHFSKLGPNMGHQYEHWFADAAEVGRFLAQHHADHRRQVVDFAETLLDTNLDPAAAFSWGAQLTTLVKSSWWTKDGRFAIWEGLGCCGLHTTDITYQGSFPLIALFPDLQRAQMRMGADYQRADGRVHHFFAPDLLHVDDGFNRVDMNPQFVMMVCRDVLWTGDLAYGRALWPHVVRAMASTAQLDADGDGIPDIDTRRNTYDQWDLEGSPSYICSLWLGALTAGIRLAKDLGEADQAEAWRALLARAERSFVKRLWNGEYFDLWATDSGRDPCCMSDQLSGQWYTNLMGLGHALPRDKVVAALRAVLAHNFDPEGGLLNASYPKGTPARLRTDQNLQAAANWTGIEYAIASMMIDFGLVDEGLAIVRSVHDRYLRAGLRWNHVECGDHYYRAMSSWATLLALTGFRLDALTGSLTVRPPLPDIVAPWFVPTGFGLLETQGGRLELTCRSGRLSLRSLKVGPSPRTPKAKLDGQALPAAARRTAAGWSVAFGDEVVVEAGKVLCVG